MRGIVQRLMERADKARAEKTATAISDAMHFEEAAKIIALALRVRDAQKLYYQNKSAANLRIAKSIEVAFDKMVASSVQQEKGPQDDLF